MLPPMAPARVSWTWLLVKVKVDDSESLKDLDATEKVHAANKTS